MDTQEFAGLRDAALRLCCAAAREALPIEEMLAHLREERAAGEGREEREEALQALEMILEAVGHVAAIGQHLLAAEPRTIAVPTANRQPASAEPPLPGGLGG